MNVMTNGRTHATVMNATLLPVAIAGMKVCTIVLARVIMSGVMPGVGIADSVNVAMAHLTVMTQSESI